MDEWLRRIADYATDVRYEDLGPDVVAAVKDRLVDSIGCGLGALTLADGCPPARIGRTVATQAARPELEGRFLGSHDRASAESAAFVNGCLIRYLDFSDTYPGHHPSDALGALLAVAPVRNATGRDLITATAISYELSIRFIRSGKFNRLGWDNGYSTGIGATAAVARLMGLTPAETRNAIAIIATANVPLRATRSGQLSMWKGAATAYSVRDAVFAAQLAASGMTGPEAPFTGRHGVMEQITGPMELEPLPTEGGPFLLPKVKLKAWPLVHNMQPLVWAGIELHDRLAGRQLEFVEVFTGANAVRESASEAEKWDPRTRETADHSAPYILAYVLRHGTIDHDAFDEGVIIDEAWRPEMRRMIFTVDDEIEAAYPETVRMRVRATDVTGTTHEIEIINPLGHDKNPMSRPALEAKFNRNSAGHLNATERRRALDLWWALEQHSATAALDALVGVTTDAPAGSTARTSAGIEAR